MSAHSFNHESYAFLVFPESGKTTVYDESATIDLDTVVIPDGGFVLKALYLYVDPYMRGRMREADVRTYSVSLHTLLYPFDRS